MTITRAVSSFLLIAAAALTPAAAQNPRPKHFPSELKAPAAKAGNTANFRIHFKLRSHELEGAGNFVVADRAQSNYVAGGEYPEEVANGRGEKGVEFKKHALIVNCVPAGQPDGDSVQVQCQFELSGPLPPVGSLKVRPIETFQYQTDFMIKRGQTLVLIDEPDRRVELKLDEVAP